MGSAWDAWRKRVKTMGAPYDEHTMWDTWEPKVLEEEHTERHTEVDQYLKTNRAK